MVNIINMKTLIGYIDNDVIRPLYLELSQMFGQINEFDDDKNKIKNKNKKAITMSLKVKDKKTWKIWEKKLKS